LSSTLFIYIYKGSKRTGKHSKRLPDKHIIVESHTTMHSLKLHFYNPKKDTEGVWNKIVSYLDPPYCHCEIEFLNGLSCAVYINGPVHMKTRTFDTNFYDCVTIPCSASVYHRALDYCSLKATEAEPFSLAMMLSTKITPLRLVKTGTFCSKMCVEALQHAGVLADDVNARLVTPSGLHHILTAPAAHVEHSGVIPALDFAV
jgi:hypothetical protein